MLQTNIKILPAIPFFQSSIKMREIIQVKMFKHANHQDKERRKYTIQLSYEYIMPVFGSDQYIYKNSFCARCNFVKHYQLLNLTAKCTTQWRGHEENENPYQRFMSYFFNFFFSQKLSQIISRPVIEIYILSADDQLAAKQTDIIICAALV